MSEFAFQTLREQIVSAIRSKILSGELIPGTRIVEQKLAEEFGSSRGPIREALRQLEQEGLVEYSRNVGCSARNVSVEDVYEIYLMCSSLEIAALQHYECRFTDREITAFREVLAEMERIPAGDLARITQCDNRFHEIIVVRAGLPRLLKSWRELNYGGLVAGVFSGPFREDLALHQHAIHTQLLEVLMKQDTPNACRAIYDHYLQPISRIMNGEET